MSRGPGRSSRYPERDYVLGSGAQLAEWCRATEPEIFPKAEPITPRELVPLMSQKATEFESQEGGVTYAE